VNFDLDEDEVALQKGIRELCRARAPLDRIRSLGGGVDRGLWRELGEAGVFALRLPEAEGGVGLGCTQAVLVFEELGRALIPGPLVASHLAAGIVEGAAIGERVVGVVERDQMPILVEHLDGLDDLIVLDQKGMALVAPGSLQARAVDRPLDPLTPMHAVDRLPDGEALGGPEEGARWAIEGIALSAALLLGIAGEATALAVGYAKERVQFDRPIGSFQAVKHILADMLVRTEVARAAVYAAGVHLDDSKGGEAARAVAGAKLLAGEAAVANAKASIQVHGGMGFTWEAAHHLFLKRAAVLATAFGSADHLSEALAGHLAEAGGSPL
jgi:alkylation response protein AidB-like acyl-CoA dehydrogenase